MASVTPKILKVTVASEDQLQGIMEIFQMLEEDSTSRDPLHKLLTYYKTVAIATKSNVVLQVKPNDNRAMIHVTRAALLTAQAKYEATKGFVWRLGKGYAVEVQESASTDSQKGKGMFQFSVDISRSA